MFLQKKTINNVPQFIHLTADTGTGAPVGSYLYLEKKSNPQGYLYCDGSTFDETVYPALYQYLGTNVLPDWREFSAVGAEQNTTSSVIATHDVFTQGEEKDDQLQNITGQWYSERLAFTGSAGGAVTQTKELEYDLGQGGSTNEHTKYSFDASRVARAGTVTRGKSKAVFIYIKATSGLTENQQENVLNTINENNSYSSEEHPTGKKWIDGKPIYQITKPILSTVKHDEWSLAGYQSASALFGSNVDTLVNTLIVSSLFMPAIVDKTQGLFTRAFNVDAGNIILEYTKTTD